MTDEGPLVEVRDLAKTYLPSPRWMRVIMRSQVKEPVRALDGVTLHVLPGEILAVAGANGAGKSTMFRVLTGLLEPTSGEVRIAGLDPVRQSPEARRLVGYVAGDDRSLWLRQTCRENLVFRAQLQGMPAGERDRRAMEVLELVGIAHARDRAGFALSAGMRARLQVACALLHRPPVLILDEPTGPIDPLGAYELLESIRALTRELRLAVLFSTHRVDEIEALAENVVLLHQGSLLHWGPLSRLRDRGGPPRVTVVFATEHDAATGAETLVAVPGVESVDRERREVTVLTHAPTGSLLGALGMLVPSIVSVVENREPLRETLAALLQDTTALRQQSPRKTAVPQPELQS